MAKRSLRLKFLRLESGVKLLELAKRSGIHYTALSQIENGRRVLTLGEAESLIKAYRQFNVEAEKEIRPLAIA